MINLRALFIMATLPLAAACTRKDTPRVQHDPAIPAVQSQKRPEPGATNAEVDQAYNKREQTIAVISDENASAEQIKSSLDELVPLVLKVESIEAQRTNSKLPELLSVFNKGLLKALQKYPQDAFSWPILEQYKQVAFSGCNEALENCRTLDFFRRDHLVPAIFLSMAKKQSEGLSHQRAERDKLATSCGRDNATCQASLKTLNEKLYADVKDFYRLLLVGGYDLHNKTAASDADSLYVRHAGEYYEYLGHAQASPATKKRHFEILNTALLNIKSQQSTSEKRQQYCDFVMELRPYAMGSGLVNQYDARGIKELVSDFISCASERKKLESSIAEHLKVQRALLEERAKTSEDPSYFWAAQKLKDTPYLMHNMQIEPISTESIYFFIIDRLFYEEIDLVLATEYYRKMVSHDDALLLKTADNYLRTQLIALAKKTIAKLGEQLRTNYEKSKGLSTDMIGDTVGTVNNETQNDWLKLLRTRVPFISDFIRRIYDEKYAWSIGNSSELSKNYVAFKEKIESLQDSLTISVQTPLMLPITYYISKTPGVVKFFVPWWPEGVQWFEADGTRALARLFDGKRNVSQLFRLGSNETKLESLQVQHSFDAALRLGLFDAVPFDLVEEDRKVARFGDAPPPGEYLFLRQILRDYFSDYKTGAENKLTEIRELQNSLAFRDRFLNACENPLAAPLTIKMSEFYSFTLLADKTLILPVEKIYSLDLYLNGFSGSQVNFQRLLDILSNYYKAKDAELRVPPAKLAMHKQILDGLREDFESYLAIERNYLRAIEELDHLIVNKERDCMARLYRAEFFRKRELTRLNQEYYRNVHAAMTLLRATAQSKFDADDRIVTLTSALKAVDTWQPEAKLDASMVADIRQRMTALATKATGNYLWTTIKNNDAREKFANALNEALNVHNDQNSERVERDSKGRVVNEIGYLVTGVPPLSEGRRIKAVNQFSGDVFTQSAWDSLARTRRLMQKAWVRADDVNRALGTKLPAGSEVPLAPYTEVILGSFAELDSNSNYREPKRNITKYQADQRLFVNDTMWQLAGYWPGGEQHFAWFTPAGTSTDLVSKRQAKLKEIMLKPLETTASKSVACADDLWRYKSSQTLQGSSEPCHLWSVSVKEYLDYSLSWRDLLDHPPEVRETIEMVSARQYNGNAILSRFQYNLDPKTENWTYFDQYYRTTITASEFGGSGTGIIFKEYVQGSSEMESFLKLKREFLRPNQHYFALTDHLTQLQRTSLRAPIMRQRFLAKDFEIAVRQIEDQVKNQTLAPLPPIVIRRDPEEEQNNDGPHLAGGWLYMPVKLREGGPRAGTPIYLKDDENSAQVFARNYFTSFVIKNTECEMLPQPSDPDFALYPSFQSAQTNDCNERNRLWQQAFDSLNGPSGQ